MSEKNFKTIRKQLRNVVQDLLPNLWTQEARQTIARDGLEDLRKDMTRRLDIIEQNVKDTLAQLDGRQKDMQSFITRSMAGLQKTTVPVTDVPLVGQDPSAAPFTANALPHRE